MDVLRICFLARTLGRSSSLSLTSPRSEAAAAAAMQMSMTVRVPVRQSRIKPFFSMTILTAGEVAGSTRWSNGGKRVSFGGHCI